MAIFAVSGEAVGASVCTGAAVLVLSAAGDSQGRAICSGSPALIVRSGGLASAAATCLGSPTLIKTVGGMAAGTASLTLVQVQRFSVLTGAAAGASSGEAFVADRDVYAAIRSSLPDVLQSSEFIKSLQQAQGIEAVRLLALIQQLLQDYFVDTASEEALILRESKLGIRVKPGQTLAQRRNRIKQRMRGPGVLTKSRFSQELKDNFYICKVETRPEEYLVKSTVLSVRGVPEDFNEMVDYADSLLPAHLINQVTPSYLPWDEIEEVKLTWDQIDQYPSWDQFETTFLIPVEEVLRRNGI